MWWDINSVFLTSSSMLKDTAVIRILELRLLSALSKLLMTRVNPLSACARGAFVELLRFPVRINQHQIRARKRCVPLTLRREMHLITLPLAKLVRDSFQLHSTEGSKVQIV